MQFALGFVTVLALLMTLAMGVVTSRLIKGERRRSAARLAALAAELKQQSSDDLPLPTPATQPPELPADAATGPRTELFGAPAALSGGGGSRVVRIAGAGLIMAVTVTLVATALIMRPQNGGADDAGETGAPVELTALTHKQQGGSLAISGTVRNPLGGLDQERLSVLATAFDDEGFVVASGRTLLTVERLAPGTESGFAVSLPTEAARRFRISFVVDDATVPHRDRRTSTPPEPKVQAET